MLAIEEWRLRTQPLPPVNSDVTEWQSSELQTIREKEEKHQSRRKRGELAKTRAIRQIRIGRGRRRDVVATINKEGGRLERRMEQKKW